MYNDIGFKIKVLAIVCGIINLIAGIIVWLVFITNMYGECYNTSDDIYAWISLVAGVIGFTFSWPLYGFGQLIEDIQDIRDVL
jgi:hypothetical protein